MDDSPLIVSQISHPNTLLLNQWRNYSSCVMYIHLIPDKLSLLTSLKKGKWAIDDDDDGDDHSMCGSL